MFLIILSVSATVGADRSLHAHIKCCNTGHMGNRSNEQDPGPIDCIILFCKLLRLWRFPIDPWRMMTRNLAIRRSEDVDCCPQCPASVSLSSCLCQGMPAWAALKHVNPAVKMLLSSASPRPRCLSLHVGPADLMSNWTHQHDRVLGALHIWCSQCLRTHENHDTSLHQLQKRPFGLGA